MAARKSTRARPSPNRPVSSQVITDIVRRLDIARAVTCTAVAALQRQAADSDNDIALILSRCVADEISGQLERLAALTEPAA